MKEFRTGSAIVRVHGNPDRDKLKTASEDFVKKVERRKKDEKKKIQKVQKKSA